MNHKPPIEAVFYYPLFSAIITQTQHSDDKTMIDAIFKFVENNPQHWWIALVVVISFAVKTLIEPLSSLIKALPTFSTFLKGLNVDAQVMAESGKKARDEMNSIAKNFGIDRVYISLFHNGTKSLSGNIHLLKLSVLTEGLSGRVGSVANTMSSRNVVEFGDIFYRVILDRETVRFEKLSDTEDTHPAFHVISSVNLVKSAYIMPMLVDGKVDAALIIECCGEEKAIDDQTLLAIQSRAQSVYNEFNAVKDRNGK